ncbi:9832_t:CDS:1, partial [Diversispora eburnea]
MEIDENFNPFLSATIIQTEANTNHFQAPQRILTEYSSQITLQQNIQP